MEFKIAIIFLAQRNYLFFMDDFWSQVIKWRYMYIALILSQTVPVKVDTTPPITI